MRDLYFMNPELKEGTNVTVRRGMKWSTAKGDNVVIKDTATDKEVGSGNVTDVSVMRFLDLVDSDLADEHDHECQNVAGLFAAMKRAYPNFDSREMVCIVSFEVD